MPMHAAAEAMYLVEMSVVYSYSTVCKQLRCHAASFSINPYSLVPLIWNMLIYIHISYLTHASRAPRYAMPYG